MLLYFVCPSLERSLENGLLLPCLPHRLNHGLKRQPVLNLSGRKAIQFMLGLVLKAPAHCADVQLPYRTTLRPLCCLLSDLFGRKVALKHTASTYCVLHSSVYVLRLCEMQ